MTNAQDALERYMGRLPEEMERKFERGREKYGDAWLEADPVYLRERMEEEMYEFRQSVEHYQDADEAVIEMADFVNFGLMYLVRSIEESDFVDADDD